MGERMPKNILIFSDGTGQAGGITFDEDRSNIYKLYRATRCGPDSCIDPAQQVAFYDPGLGSPADGGFMFGKLGRRLYNLASQATGLGITANIIDCYAALIRLYREGDRIFLFGFSRGAYTVRCLAAVIAKCGVPQCLQDGRPLPRDVKGARRLAADAVKNVYQFCSSQPRTADPSHTNFLLDTRELIAQRFRKEHGSSAPGNAAEANAYPYFIGVFDTVAALGRPGAMLLLLLALAIMIAGASYAISLVTALSGASGFGWLRYLTLGNVAVTLTGSIVAALLASYLSNYVKFDFGVPGYTWLQSFKTIHLAPPKHKFTEYSLNPKVPYAKHAISIDENRYDFKRVRWNPDARREATRDESGNIYFEQVWFAGVHADIGGGYSENESRLSDTALYWMLAGASIIPHGLIYDNRVLKLFPDAKGIQHDECKAGRWQRGVRDLPTDIKTHISEAAMHLSVYARFKEAEVVQYDVSAPYRPLNMKCHVDFAHYYTGGPAPAGQKAIADHVEYRWEKLKASQAAGLNAGSRKA
jgi:hypothetical protein